MGVSALRGTRTAISIIGDIPKKWLKRTLAAEEEDGSFQLECTVGRRTFGTGPQTSPNPHCSRNKLNCRQPALFHTVRVLAIACHWKMERQWLTVNVHRIYFLWCGRHNAAFRSLFATGICACWFADAVINIVQLLRSWQNICVDMSGRWGIYSECNGSRVYHVSYCVPNLYLRLWGTSFHPDLIITIPPIESTSIAVNQVYDGHDDLGSFASGRLLQVTVQI